MQRTMITHNRLFWSGRTAHVNGLIDICKVHNPLFLWLPAGSCIRGLKKSGVKPPHSIKERGSHGALRSKGRCGDRKHSCELVSIRG